MFRHNALCLTAFLSNTIPMGLATVLFSYGTLANADFALWGGIGTLIAAIALALFSHLKLNNHPIAWLSALLLAGISKGALPQ